LSIFRESFYHDLILNPSSEAEDRWTSREYCLWGAPDWLSYPEVLCLGRLQEYRTLSSLFQITLEVGNAGSAHFLDYLKYIRGFLGAVPSDEEKARIPLIYNELNTEDNDNETKQRIKYMILYF
jgi:hypothetical protein